MMSWRKIIPGLALAAMTLILTQASSGQQLLVYPAKGQSPQQTSQDKYECYQWAVQQTGFNPEAQAMNAPQTVQQPPPSGPRLGRKARMQEEQAQIQKNAQKSKAANMQEFTKAQTVCLQGRGYTVTTK